MISKGSKNEYQSSLQNEYDHGNDNVQWKETRIINMVTSGSMDQAYQHSLSWYFEIWTSSCLLEEG